MPVVSPREALAFFRSVARAARGIERGAEAGQAVARAVERLGAGQDPADVARALGDELRKRGRRGGSDPAEDPEPEPVEVEVVSARKVDG